MSAVLEALKTPAVREVFLEAATHGKPGEVVTALRRTQPASIERMRAGIADDLNDLGKRVEVSYLRVERPVREAAAPGTADRANLIEHILTASALREWAGSRLAPSFLRNYEAMLMTTARTLIQAGLLENVRGQAASAIIREGGRRAGLVDITGDTRAALFRALDQAREEGLGPRQVGRLIRDLVPEGRFVNAGSSYRATMIARSEMLNAQRASSMAHYRANRIGHVIAFDGEGDDECAARNGQLFTLDEADDEMANTHPNCILAFGPVAA